MSGKIVECVPNFSEGRDTKTIEAISEAIRSTDGVRLLDVDPGASTNRTVYTFVGGPSAVVEAALAAASAAYKHIDMTKHEGSHPRMGALDVCPFVPVSGVTEEECVALANEFGRRLAATLGVPVFLYGKAAVKGDHRQTMPQIRAGQYEGLKQKLQEPEWVPDFGAAEFVPRWGATVTGVRKFLIAYNINMIATKEQAHKIALNLRTQGRGVGQEGRLQHCQAIGWYLEEKNMAQISVNLSDFDVTPIHVAYEEACADARAASLPVTGSEIVGLVPLRALLAAAQFYIEKEQLFVLGEDQQVQLAINRLGLTQLGPFDPKTRIIEYCLCEGAIEGRLWGPLGRGSVGGFVAAVGARAAAPGGGSVAALVAAMGAALGAMVGQLTYGKKQWEALDAPMRGAIKPLHEKMQKLTRLIDEDTKAFEEFMAASRLPKATDEEIATKERRLATASEGTVAVPLAVMRHIGGCWQHLGEVARLGNVNCRSDAQVAARCLETGSWAAFYNVEINLDGIGDVVLRGEMEGEAKMLLEEAQAECKKVLAAVEARKTS